MFWQKFVSLGYWRQDFPAAIVVFLLALPLTLGIALASGVPMISSVITAVVGGLVVSLISKSPLNVSGPAASMAVIVLNSVQTLPSFHAFLMAVVLAGVIQIFFGIFKAGILGELLPASVISGMLAAIGITIILNQIPHALGYDKNYLWQTAEKSDLDTLSVFLQNWKALFSLEAIVIASVSLAILLGWNHKKNVKPVWLQPIPVSLLAIAAGILVDVIFQSFFPAQALGRMHFVEIPVITSFHTPASGFSFPDFSYLTHIGVWSAAFSMAIIASIQVILGIEGVDKLDPLKRTTPLNLELVAQGIGNVVSGMLGGILLTSVIVRSLANVTAGARTKASAILQGFFLLIFVLLMPQLLNQIPLAALATVLVYVGFQLVKPAVFVQSYKKGWAHLLPFLATIVAILWTDLLTGVCTGLIVAVVFILRDTLLPLYSTMQQGNHLTVYFEKKLTFIQKHELNQLLKQIPANSALTLDISKIDFIDEDIMYILQEFIQKAPHQCIKIHIQTSGNPDFAILTAAPYELA